MTAYVTLAASDKDPDSPITTNLINALDQNPLAIAENDATAPTLVGRPITFQADDVADGDASTNGDNTIITGPTVNLTAGQTLIVFGSVQLTEVPGAGAAEHVDTSVQHNGVDIASITGDQGGSFFGVSTAAANGAVTLVINATITAPGVVQYRSANLFTMVLDG